MRLDRQDTITNLKFVISRTGNISVYGDITAEYIPLKGKTIEIGLARGVAVYTSVDKRNFSVRILNTRNLNLESGKIKVKFTSPKDSPYELYAEKEIELKKRN
jgi:hypothetical protein